MPYNKEFETAQEAAERLGETVRAIQKWAAVGKLSGATRHGNVWMIPKGAEPSGKQTKTDNKSEKLQDNGIPDVYQLTPFRMAMPLMNSNYPVGKCMEYIEAMSDPDDKNIALSPIKQQALWQSTRTATIRRCVSRQI